MDDLRELPGYWLGYYASVRESMAELYARLPAEWRSRLLVDLARTAAAGASTASIPVAPSRLGDPLHFGAPAGPNLGVGLHWFKLDAHHRYVREVLGVADLTGAARVVVRIACADAHRWQVECAARAILAALTPPRPRAEADLSAAPKEWRWTDGGDGSGYGLARRWQLAEGDAPLLACWAAPCAAWAADAAGRELGTRLTLPHVGGRGPGAHLKGCRAERAAGGLVRLGDFVDGRVRYHADRRAAREGPKPRPTLVVVRGSARRPLARPGPEAA